MKAKRKSQRVYGKRSNRRTNTGGAWASLDPDSKAQEASSPRMASPPQANSTHRPSPLSLTSPMSQKAATMTAPPASDDIDTVTMITGIDRDLAIRYLKAKHNDVNAAVNSILESEDINNLESSSTWDESAWNTDREGGVGNDDNLRPLGSSTAPTRGPSPAPSLNMSNPKNKNDEDSQLAAAVAASRADMGLPFEQETGVIRKTTPDYTFGPATKAHYEENSWALVPSSATEVVPDVDAPQRQHVLGEPRLLKHLPDGDYTPNLLTICHSIPGVRDALLMYDTVQPSYGYDSDWWRGHPIPLSRTIHVQEENGDESDHRRHDELLAEVQRVMAFLGTSDRSYATVGGLTQTEVIKNNSLTDTRSGTLLELFVRVWSSAAHAKLGASSEKAGLFTTLVGTTSTHGLDTPELLLTEMNVNLAEGQKADLSEMLDDLLWDTDPDDAETPDNYIEKPSEVIIMMLRQQKSGATQLGVEVPAVLHLDKYLRENVEATKGVRQRIAHGKQRVAKIEEIENRLMKWQHPKKSTKIETRDLLAYTLGHFSGQNRHNADQADKTNFPSLEQKQYSPHYAEITTKLEAIVSRIDKKLDTLASEKEKTRKAISEFSKSVPAELQESNLKHRYMLRGVSTKPHITYFLSKKQANTTIMDTDEAEDDTTPEGMEWWRAEYDASGSRGRISMSKAADYDVLRAVELEHNSALLVYASDRISSDEAWPVHPLPPALAEFIHRDNQTFQQELQDYEHSRTTGAYDITLSDVPRESIERTSMDTTRVEGGGSPPSFSSRGRGSRDASPDPFTAQYEVGQNDMHLDRDHEPEPEVHEIKLDDMSDREDVSAAPFSGSRLETKDVRKNS